jgi:hypothetical protein
MLYGGFRVRAARGRGKAKSLDLTLFQNPLHPVSRAVHSHAQTNVVKPQIPNSTAEQIGA